MSDAVKKIIDELNKRYLLLNDSIIINTKDYDLVIKLLSQNNVSYPLYQDDIKLINITDLKNILHLIGEFSADELVSKSNDENTTFAIANIINRYIIEFNEFKNNQEQMIKEKKEYYQKYIDLFEKEKFETLFTEFDELDSMLSSLNFDIEDRYKLFNYIDEKNKKLIKYDDINYVANITNSISKYLSSEYDNYKKIIKKYIGNTTIDVDLLPTVAEVISFENNLDNDITLNVLSSLIITNLIDQKKNDQIDIALNYIKKDVDDRNNVVSKCKEIVQNYYSFYNMYKDKESEYLNKSLAEIENDEIDYDMAIEYKKLPIIDLMIDNINKLGSNEDIIYDILAETLKEYNNLDSKKK